MTSRTVKVHVEGDLTLTIDDPGEHPDVPAPATNLLVELQQIVEGLTTERTSAMRSARLKFSWTPSISPDIVSQNLEVTVNGNPLINENFGTFSSSYTATDEELAESNTTIEMVVTSINSVGGKMSAMTTYQVPILGNPQPPTNLGIEMVEVVDDQVPVGPVTTQQRR